MCSQHALDRIYPLFQKRSVDQNYLLGKVSLIAKVQVEKGKIVTSAEREVKVSRRSGMYQSCNFLTRLGKQSL